MLKKRLLIALAVTFVLVVPFSVFAATSDTPVAKNIRGLFGLDVSKLTEKQKADVTDYTKKMADLQKDFVNKMVENGSITKEQGEAEIKRIDELQKDSTEKGFIPGFGMGKGGFKRHGMKGDFGLFGIDISNLTEKQKADLADHNKKMIELQKESVNKMVANGLLTKTQGESIIKRVDEMAGDAEKNGLPKGPGMLMGGMKLFGPGCIDTSNLTDKQKADLNEMADKMAALQKDLINRMVANGAMTKEQGTAAIQKIDEMLKFQKENGFPRFSNGFEMKKGRFGRPGWGGRPDMNTGAPAGLDTGVSIEM